MNKYLEKVAELLTDENKQVAHTFVEDAAIGAPAAALGGWAGKVVGSRYGKPSVGTFVGSHIAGGIAGIAAIKHSLHGKVGKQ